MSARILIVEDDPATGKMVEMALRSAGYQTTGARSFRQAKELLAGHSFDLFLCDLYLGDGTSLDLLRERQGHAEQAPVVVFTAHGSVETAVEAIDQGAFDYLAKPFSVDDLLQLVGRALSLSAQSPSAAPEEPPGQSPLLVGNSAPMVALYKRIALAARCDSPVLISGETGTGKELVARCLHRFSRRNQGPFVAVNCGALTESLLESELFGHQRGAFTGASVSRRGLFQQAEKGTLFLDEISETTTAFQVKLLRALQEKEIRPVGGNAPLPVDTRIVAATNRDLPRELERGRFRKDLFYRLSVITLEVPPLRARAEDIPQLVRFFLEKAAAGRSDPLSITSAALQRLQEYAWPGNVRELENAVQRSVVLKTSSVLDLDDFAFLPDPAEADDRGLNCLQSQERETIQRVMQASRGNRSEAARRLGIGRRSLYRKAERLGINLNESS